MSDTAYCYRFQASVSMCEVEATLLLAVWGTESLHPGSNLDHSLLYEIQTPSRLCVIFTDTPAGHDLNRLFSGYLRREFGPGAWTLSRQPPDRVRQLLSGCV